MKVSVVYCDCRNPKPHRKLATDDGRQTGGFFSIEHGVKILHDMLDSGEIAQTTDEIRATLAELNNCGLRSEQFTDDEISDEELLEVVKKLMEFPSHMREGLVAMGIANGILSTNIADRIVLKLAEAENGAIPLN